MTDGLNEKRDALTGDVYQSILDGRTALGMELGSTRIKAVLVDEHQKPIASGSHDWENRYVDNIWTYTLEDIWEGVQDSFAKLAADVKARYGITWFREKKAFCRHICWRYARQSRTAGSPSRYARCPWETGRIRPALYLPQRKERQWPHRWWT